MFEALKVILNIIGIGLALAVVYVFYQVYMASYNGVNIFQ